MWAPAIYKIIHLTGILMLFLALGSLICRSRLDGRDYVFRKIGGITSGIGLLMALIGGFGLLAKMKLGFPPWVVGKIIIWIIFGGLIAFINRRPNMAMVNWFFVIFLGILAAFLAIVKPF